MHGDNPVILPYRRFATVVLVLNIFSALLFIATVRKPVYDDSTNFRDVHRYASEGATLQSIRAHVNPTGPGSFLWMAAGIRLLGGDEIRDARLAVLASWLILGIGILIAADRSELPELWYAALLITLVFPHTMTTSATLMTEGPALLAALLGTFVWIRAISLPRVTLQAVGLLLLAGLGFGLAITCRQYYIALLPAAAAVAILQLLKQPAHSGAAAWTLAFVASLLVAVIPMGLLILAWKGLSSPSIASGASYTQWKAAVGLNFTRPLTAIFAIAAWLIPLTFPAMWHVRSVKRFIALCAALAAGVTAAHFRDSLVQPGPLHSLQKMASGVPHGEFLAIAGLGAAALYNSVAVAMLLIRNHSEIARVPAVVFSLFVLLFFVLEQFGIGGNIPFYDRYVLQVAPFLGIIAFSALPKLTPWRVTVFGLMVLFSNVLLWRNGFGS
jgi:hypothetical protein